VVAEWEARGFQVDFGSGPFAVHAATTKYVDLTGAYIPVPSDGPVNWSELDKFPDCITIVWKGSDRGVVDAVTSRPQIKFLYWDEARGDLDLTSTSVESVRLTGPGVTSVRLPRTIEDIFLRRASPAIEVHAPDDGREMRLRHFTYGADVRIPHGLRRVATVWLWVGGRIAAARPRAGSRPGWFSEPC
jgi:hypothetical protein